jgi:hypothetical protein
MAPSHPNDEEPAAPPHFETPPEHVRTSEVEERFLG